jgi:glycolate oxidase iron-sulfur subunit
MVRGAASAPSRAVIRRIPGVTLKEMKKPDRCCGSAGSFSLTHDALSNKIRDKKIADILAVSPDMVLTTCGACRMQIEEGLYHAECATPLHHVAELLASAYEREETADKGNQRTRHKTAAPMVAG